MSLTRWFGVTESDADRDPAREQADIEAITEKSLLMQANAADKQHRSMCRGTHASGVSVRAQFEIFDLTVGHAPELAARLARGIFAKPRVYPAVVRFANADASINSDFKPDVRSLSFSVDLAPGDMAGAGSIASVPLPWPPTLRPTSAARSRRPPFASRPLSLGPSSGRRR